MLEIAVTPEELKLGRLDADRHAAAVRAIREDGFVVLADVISAESIASLREKVLDDVQKLLSRPDRPFNWNPGNLQQNPPPFPPYLFRDVLVNDVAISVTKAVLGAGLKNAFYSGNTALPSEHRQPVHADLGQLWPDLDVAHPAYGLVVNAPLVDMDAQNGSTEIWPGTHLDTSVAWQHGDITVSPEKLDARAEVVPPIQPKVRAGSMLIRDIRMWHAGMPNRTQNPRPMLAMIHYVSWWLAEGPLRFPKGTEDLFEHPDLYTYAEYTDDMPDYIAAPQAYGI